MCAARLPETGRPAPIFRSSRSGLPFNIYLRKIEEIPPLDSSYSPHGLIGEAYRPPKIGSKGAVVANHTLAAQGGMQILHRGGNAVDAAIAIAFALGPAEPQGSSIGGDGFVMVHMVENRKIDVVNGTGAAPLAATADKYSGGIPITGVLGTSVPGILDALLAAHDKYGTLPLAQCLEPAIEL